MSALPVPPPDDPNLDLGFGAVVARESGKRLLNRDGTFNVRRQGLRFFESLSGYHYFLTISWSRFLSYVTLAFVLMNALFAAGYLACGPRALSGFANATWGARFLQAFFFSVHTLATIGYGNIVPITLAANLVVTVESLAGLLGFSVIAGIVFARFARPVAQIRFSRHAIVAPYRGITAVMFRIANQKSNELVEMEAKVLLSRRKDGGAATDREFLQLKLERERVTFFPLTWTIVHPIDNASPLYGKTPQDLVAADAELLILLNGFDETFSQTVHTRSSYKPEEMVWGARFTNILNRDKDGAVTVDVRQLHEIERVSLE
jgi:inward rectifier potassium channel